MVIEWDNNKNKANIRNHKISFETASLIFKDKNILIKSDSHTTEDRWNAIGYVGTVLFVVFTEKKGSVIRLISARKATKGEIDEYNTYNAQ